MALTEAQSKKRKKIEKTVIGFMNAIDKSGLNANKYKKFFAGMSDNQFLTWIRKFLKDDDMNFYMEIVPYKNEPVLKDIKDGAAYLDIPLDEYIYYRHDDNKDNPIRSPHPVPVGYLNIKRMQQILMKKNSYNLDVSKRNLKTNQLTADSKVARITDAETFSLSTYGADEALKEFMGPRADDAVAKREMLQDIMTQGYTTSENYTNELKNKHTLNTVDVHFTGAGIKTDLVNGSLKLEYTKEQEKRSAAK